MIIKFKILATHNFPAVALPDYKAKFEFDEKGIIKPWQIDTGEKKIDVIPVDKFSFPINELPNMLSYGFFGASAEDVRKRMLQVYPELMRSDDLNKVKIAYVICKIV
jgi:hypothetical protein